jgi:type II secretory pathway pseudopilin PulG
MNNHQGHHADTSRRAFTLIELLVVFVITLVLLTLVLSGLNRATKAGRRASTQESVSSLAKAVDQFKQEFGFLPPLVHDGMPVSAGDSAYRPFDFLTGGSLDDGPTFLVDNGPYEYQTLVVWNEGVDAEFFRGRNNGGPYESGWDEDQAWNDRRYSKYALAFYLTGVLDKSVDGVRGPGMTRPIVDGSFLGVGYPVGSVREKYEPLMDTERRGARVINGYVEPKEVVEHDNGGSVGDADSVRSMYEDYQREQLFSFVDSFGTAFRYYRWEPGRLVGLQRVINSELDLNIPPVLIDPVQYERAQNDPMNLERADVTFIGENSELREARYAVVSAGPDGYFGTESIETIAEFLDAPVPSSSEDAALLRREVWADNLFEVGR